MCFRMRMRIPQCPLPRALLSNAAVSHRSFVSKRATGGSREITNIIMDLMSLVPNETSSIENDSLNRSNLLHYCRVNEEKDEISTIIGNGGFIKKIREWIIRKSILSKNDPITRCFITSSAAINYEISRHIRFYPYIVHPFSHMRLFFERFITIFTMIALVLVPIILAFDFYQSDISFYIIFIINIVFIIDIVMTFFTGHYDDTTRIVVLDRKIVAGKYLKSFFVLDLLSAIPVEVFNAIIIGSNNAKWYIVAINLVKIFRLRNIVYYSRKHRHLYWISIRKYKIYEISLVVILLFHWATCLELYIALIGREIIGRRNVNRGSWLISETMNDKDTKFKIYLICANRAIASLVSSSHYLDVKTPEDILLNLILTIVGRIGFIYIIAQFFQLTSSFHSTRKKNSKIVQQLQQFMRYKELPYPIQRRILDYHKYCNKKSFDKYIVGSVSPCLREQLLLHNYSRLIDSVNFFKFMPRQIVTQIVELFRMEVYLTNDTIVKAGSIGDAFFYIAAGTVAIYSNTGKEVCHLENGAYFGDSSLVMENERRQASVVAIETCEIWILKRTDFLKCITPHPSLLNRLQRITIERLEKNLRARTLRIQDGFKVPTTN